MKQKQTYILLWLVGVFLIPLLHSCNNSDDIEAIFYEQKWYLGNFYTTTQWDDVNNRKPYFSLSEETEAVKIINNNGQDRFFVTFNDHRTFTAKGLDNVFSGTYKVDGKNNTLTFNITNGNAPNDQSSLAKRINYMFYMNIKNCAFYYGSTIYLKFFPKEKRSFMQFSKNRQ